MIARVRIFLPYAFTVPEKEQYKLYTLEGGGYQVKFYMPERSEKADTYNDGSKFSLNSHKAFQADILRIDFIKDSFDRSINDHETEESYDPPLGLITDVAYDFIRRLRYVINASSLKVLDPPFHALDIQYLNDDESELEPADGFVRTRGKKIFHTAYMAINNKVWDDVHSLEPFAPLPPWNELLLDAEYILPEIGPSIILTFTALEVFITKSLNSIAPDKEIPQTVWNWINGRGAWKDPSIDEKYDTISKIVFGESLKSNDKLWLSFKHLKKARNTFAHTGVAKIGDIEVDVLRVRQFIGEAKEIINFYRCLFPEEYKWIEFNHEMKVSFAQKIR